MHDTTLGLRKLFALALIILLPTLALAQTRRAPAFDVIIRGGTVYDGSGGPPRRADVGLRGDRISAIGNPKTADAGAACGDARTGAPRNGSRRARHRLIFDLRAGLLR